MLLPTALIALTGVAGAYTLKTDDAGNELHWTTATIPVQFNLDQTAGLDVEAVRRAMAHATSDFRDVSGSHVRFEIEGFNGPRGIDHADDANSVFFVTDWEDRELDDTLLAVTYTWYLDGGEIIGFDMVINASNHEWATDQDPERNDLYNTMTHEFGHALGLGHSDVDEASMYATTYPGELEKRELHEDDGDALRYLYGEPMAAGAGAGFPVACSTGGTGAMGGIPMLLSAMAAIGLMRRRRGSDSQGDGAAQSR